MYAGKGLRRGLALTPALPIAWDHALPRYTVLENRTAVDKELDKLRGDQSLRLLHLPGGMDQQAVCLMSEYLTLASAQIQKAAASICSDTLMSSSSEWVKDATVTFDMLAKTCPSPAVDIANLRDAIIRARDENFDEGWEAKQTDDDKEAQKRDIQDVSRIFIKAGILVPKRGQAESEFWFSAPQVWEPLTAHCFS